MRFHYLPHMPLNVDKNVDSAEYANIVLTFTRFYDQARRGRHARAARLGPRAGPAVDQARDQRLLDPQRLHELGLRPRLRPLAPGQEVRAHAGGADRRRHRCRSRCSPGAEYGALRQVHARPRASTSTARESGALEERRPGPAVLRRQHRAPGRRLRPARRGARDGQRRAGRGRRDGQHARRRSRRRCTRSTPTSAASPSRRRSTTPRSSPSTRRRSPTAASTWRGCSTASRKWWPTSAAARRPPSA